MDAETRRQLAAALAGLIDQGMDDNAPGRARDIAERFGFTVDELRMAMRAADPLDHEALADWLCAHAGVQRAKDDAAAAQLLADGQEEVFSRAEVERGLIEHNTGS